MRRWHSLWLRLLIAFVLVVAVAVGTVAIVTNQATERQFQIYVGQGRQMRAERLAPDVAAYYVETGSWVGVADWLAGIDASGLPRDGQSQGQGRGRGQAGGGLTDRLVLAAAGGEVLADTDGVLTGDRLSGAELDMGVPVEVDGRVVGVLLVPAAGAVYETPEAEFLKRVNQTLLWAGLAAGAAALILGSVLARQFTAPLRALTQATRRLAQAEADLESGQDVPQVDVRRQDEIGELAHSFNQMARSLAQQQTLRRNLMADIAHELRTPLSVIRGDLEALLDGVYDATPETLASLQEETLLLQRLVDDLRELAQAEAGQLRLQLQPVDLTGLLRGVVAGFDLQAGSQGQVLELDLGAEALVVDADPQRVRQIVANLVSNSLRHADSIGGQVVVSAREKHGEAVVMVSDDGPGIPAEELPHLFDRFWRGRSARADGSGLGLAIARQLVLALGGRIWVESEPGRGTVFCFSLKLHPS